MIRSERITNRMQLWWDSAIAEEQDSSFFDRPLMEWAHRRGFLAETACALGLNESNVDQYISDYDYACLWPLNSWQRIWVNDKLTLWQVLSGTQWEHLLPEYYFYTENGSVHAMPVSSYDSSIPGFAQCLKEQGELACKPCNGSLSRGFHKLEYFPEIEMGKRSGEMVLDGELRLDDQALESFIKSHQNYVITEYIHPKNYLAEIHPLIHTLRVVVARVNGVFEIIGAYIRFATGGSQGNYITPTLEESNYFVGVDTSTGRFGNGKIIYANRIEDSSCHPTSKVPAEGTLAEWENVKAASLGISETLGFVEFLGFDFGITNKGLRLMEINSHPGLKCVQLFHPICDNPMMASYFAAKLDSLDALDDAAVERRRMILR